MGREGSWWILLGSLSWMGLLLAPLEAWSRSRSGTRGRSLGGGRRIVLKLLLLRLLLLRLRLLLLRLLRARLRGPGLWAVSCWGMLQGRHPRLHTARGVREAEQGEEGVAWPGSVPLCLLRC